MGFFLRCSLRSRTPPDLLRSATLCLRRLRMSIPSPQVLEVWHWATCHSALALKSRARYRRCVRVRRPIKESQRWLDTTARASQGAGGGAQHYRRCRTGKATSTSTSRTRSANTHLIVRASQNRKIRIAVRGSRCVVVRIHPRPAGSRPVLHQQSLLRRAARRGRLNSLCAWRPSSLCKPQYSRRTRSA